VRSEARVAALQDDSDTLNVIYEDLEAEVEELANRHGYTYGTLEGDGAHFVLAPLLQN